MHRRDKTEFRGRMRRYRVTCLGRRVSMVDASSADEAIRKVWRMMLDSGEAPRSWLDFFLSCYPSAELEQSILGG